MLWWGVALGGLLGVGVVVLTHISYGEVTIARQVRINWWSGCVDVVWGACSAASGEVISMDGVWWDGWKFRWMSPYASMGFAGGGASGFHTGLIAGLVSLLWGAQITRFVLCPRKQVTGCGRCGYSREGLTGEVCPECGDGANGGAHA